VRRFPYGIFFEVQEQDCGDRVLPRQAQPKALANAVIRSMLGLFMYSSNSALPHSSQNRA
jgi:hypothetical protein